MEQIKQMNKEIFKENLLKSIQEILKGKGFEFNDYRFIIEPVSETDKPLNSECF